MLKSRKRLSHDDDVTGVVLVTRVDRERERGKFVLVNEREHLGFEYKDILTLFVSPVKMIPLASRRISPVVCMEKVFLSQTTHNFQLFFY